MKSMKRGKSVLENLYDSYQYPVKGIGSKRAEESLEQLKREILATV